MKKKPVGTGLAPESSFIEVVELIQKARQRAFQSVNTALIDLYWQVGATISRKIETAVWGEGVVDQLAQYISAQHPDIKGFTRASLFRMKQFFELYRHEQKVAALLRQLPWTHHLTILARCKRPEEREFYLRNSIKEHWSSRELERQLNGALFERTILAPPKVAPLVRLFHPKAEATFKDSYLVDFLDLPEGHTEGELQHALIKHLRRFLLELGKDFCFVGEEYLLQVGNRDFRVDLLFYHRELQCLVAFELKIGQFEPAHLGQLEFYLEALDRNIKKPHERASIGVLLCASKDNEVVEYALSRSMSPALVSEYQTSLPDKKILQAKLHEFYALEEASKDPKINNPRKKPI